MHRVLRSSRRNALGWLVLGICLALGLEHARTAAREEVEKSPKYPTFGTIVRVDPAFDKLIPAGAKLEKLASGFDWAEGPVWWKENKTPHDSGKGFGDLGGAKGVVLFSDIPPNRIMQWHEGQTEAQVLYHPAGYTGKQERGGEPGTNGLAIDPKGRLTMCEHGDRRVSRMERDGRKTTLADKYNGKRLNSPNDLCFKSNGDIYFTDPPYGLEKNWDDPAREQDFCGVYRISAADGKVTLLTKELSRPNGIGFSPDEKTLYVANSDPERPIWMAFAVREDGSLGAGRVFFDATEWFKAGKKGLPDGLKVDRSGNVFATGPGGVHVFSAAGKYLGSIDTGEATANCGWGDDGSTLYITADMYLARVRTTTKGAGW